MAHGRCRRRGRKDTPIADAGQDEAARVVERAGADASRPASVVPGTRMVTWRSGKRRALVDMALITESPLPTQALSPSRRPPSRPR